MSEECMEVSGSSLDVENSPPTNETHEEAGYAPFIKKVIRQDPQKAAEKPSKADVCETKFKQITGPPWNSQSAEDLSPHHSDFEQKQLTLGFSDIPVMCILEKCVETMLCGEECIVHFQLGPLAQGALCDTVQYGFEVQLVSIQRCKKIWTLSAAEKFAKAEELKSLGVTLFKVKYVDLAFEKFSQSLKILICMLPETEIPEDLFERYQLLRCQCYANMAMCQLAYKNYDFVIANCTKALNIQADNVKCLYRRALAYKALKENTNSLNDLKLANQLEPGNKIVKEELETIKKLVKEEDKLYSQICNKMIVS